MRGNICSSTMDGDSGDLGDIIRASGCRDVASTSCHTMIAPNWQSAPETPNFLPPAERHDDSFGSVPFSDLGDPLLHELSGGTTFFDRLDPFSGLVEKNVARDDDGAAAATVGGGCGDSVLIKQNSLGVDETKGACNIFCRVLQLSPGLQASSIVPPRGIKPAPPVLSGVMAKVDTIRRLDEGGPKNSSPRAPGIKRRKNQAKKVVCIPAPAAASSKPGGEVVPSDLWAWRKYGQKPIKGSPYPRGYYRCSSSKGCSARKQVERSRTDPNMLVITYTSEHNHPWPTQRNAFAGTPRSLQPPRSSSSAPKSSPQATEIKEEPKEELNTAGASPQVKEETPETRMTTTGVGGDRELDHVSHRSGGPTSLLETSQSDDFFADLGELESDLIRLVSSKEFLGDQLDEEGESDPMDPFSCCG